MHLKCDGNTFVLRYMRTDLTQYEVITNVKSREKGNKKTNIEIRIWHSLFLIVAYTYIFQLNFFTIIYTCYIISDCYTFDTELTVIQNIQ